MFAQRVLLLPSKALVCRFQSKSAQKLPSGLSNKLIHGKRTNHRFPDVQNSLSLARNLAQAEVSCDEFVNKMVISYQHLMHNKHFQDFQNLKQMKTSPSESSIQ